MGVNKKTARAEGLRKRKELSEEERKAYSEKITETVLPLCRKGSVTGIYVSLPEEADTHELIRRLLAEGRQVAVPKTHPDRLTFHLISSFDELKPGVWGIPEPDNDRIIEPDRIDVMIVPLSSFDRCGHRTGWGKGYYDSVLNEHQHRIGIGFSCQMCECIEADPWDVSLDEAVSEEGRMIFAPAE